MATDDCSILLPAESGHRISFYVELLLPVQLLAPAGDGTVQTETWGLLLHAVLQLVPLRVDWSVD